tara:strand:+ start:2306 stop:2470 length:165 start_codon:yes stop_codon:yes gene_type:complete
VSYIIVDKTTEKAVAELYDKKLIELINTDKYKVVKTYEYLCALNKKTKLTANQL